MPFRVTKRGKKRPSKGSSKGSSKRSSNAQGSGKGSNKRQGSGSGSGDKNKDQPGHIELYCVMLDPAGGTLHHWAFATLGPSRNQWNIFEAVQDGQDGLFVPVERQDNPLTSQRCLKPLTLLGRISACHWDTLVRQVRGVQVPGEAEDWNCQNYVLEVWESLMLNRVVDYATWSNGNDLLEPLAGREGEDGALGRKDEERGQDDTRGPISEEFVYDSSD